MADVGRRLSGLLWNRGGDFSRVGLRSTLARSRGMNVRWSVRKATVCQGSVESP